MAQTLAGYLDIRHITGLSGGDLEMNSSLRRGFAPGQPTWQHDSFGLRLFTLVQNRSGTAFTRGQLVSGVGSAAGLTVVTASTSTTTSVSFALAALTTNQHVGAIALIGGLAASTAAVAGETSIVVSNTSASVLIDSRHPFSAAPSAALELQLISTYNTELSASGDTNQTVRGVAIGQNGISTGNFGFVQSVGFCPRVNKDTATTFSVFTTGNNIAACSGSGNCYMSSTATNTTLLLGKIPAPASSAQTQASVMLMTGHPFNFSATGATN